VLECAVKQGTANSLRDCDEFPCDKYFEWLFPYGKDYLEMQTNRRKQQQEGERAATVSQYTFSGSSSYLQFAEVQAFRAKRAPLFQWKNESRKGQKLPSLILDQAPLF
jgi:hypothetical protein